jgi:hypothetical protein
MAERMRRRKKARSTGSRKAAKRARPKGRAARGKAPKPKKKTARKPKAAGKTRPSPRRPVKATGPAATPEVQTPLAGQNPEAPVVTTESGREPAADADET